MFEHQITDVSGITQIWDHAVPSTKQSPSHFSLTRLSLCTNVQKWGEKVTDNCIPRERYVRFLLSLVSPIGVLQLCAVER